MCILFNTTAQEQQLDWCVETFNQKVLILDSRWGQFCNFYSNYTGAFQDTFKQYLMSDVFVFTVYGFNKEQNVNKGQQHGDVFTIYYLLQVTFTDCKTIN